MTTKRFIPVAALCALALGACGSADDDKIATLTLESRFDESTGVQLDNGTKGESPGDVFGGGSDLLRDGKPYGRFEAVLQAVDGRYAGNVVTGVLLLPDGTLSVSGGGVDKPVPGLPKAPADDTYAVIGGTGKYAGQRGEMRMTSISDTADRISVSLHG